MENNTDKAAPKTKLLILHVDDSSILRRSVLSGLLPFQENYTLKQTSSYDETCAFLETNVTPDLIIADWMMGDKGGLELIQWIKTHPKFHTIPVSFLTAESSESFKFTAMSNGAISILHKPCSGNDINDFIRKTYEHLGNQKNLISIEEFNNEAEFLLKEIELSSKSNDDKILVKIFQSLHTLKGISATSQWPLLAKACHEVEDLIQYSLKEKIQVNGPVLDVINDFIIYFKGCLTNLKLNQQHVLFPADIQLKLKNVNVGISSGWFSTPKQNNVIPSAPNDESAIKNQNQQSDWIKIQIKKFEEIQTSIENIFQIKTQINQLSVQLDQKFPDESLTKELSKMVRQLDEISKQTLTNLQQVRTLPFAKLVNTLEAALSEANKTTGKSSLMNTTGDLNIQVDRNILENLQRVLPHLIRNAIDHGIESSDKRIQLGKKPEGHIHLSWSLEPSKDTSSQCLTIKIEDDGEGLKVNLIKAKIKELGLLPEAQLSNMSVEQIQNSIFMDQLSTAQKNSEISGRGVGLSAAKSSIESIGGQISVQSSNGKGTSFEIRIVF